MSLNFKHSNQTFVVQASQGTLEDSPCLGVTVAMMGSRFRLQALGGFPGCYVEYRIVERIQGFVRRLIVVGLVHG